MIMKNKLKQTKQLTRKKWLRSNYETRRVFRTHSRFLQKQFAAKKLEHYQ